jgi:hypothetical protein
MKSVYIFISNITVQNYVHMLSGVQFILNKKDTRVWEADSQGRLIHR